jgi:SAM-dependent methyltransferase
MPWSKCPTTCGVATFLDELAHWAPDTITTRYPDSRPLSGLSGFKRVCGSGSLFVDQVRRTVVAAKVDDVMATINGAVNGAKNGAAADYDQLPYPSMPIAYTQPGALAAMAALFGAQPSDAAAASVLELGCASGGNIVPLAARFPQARFLGVDLSARHVAEANARIAALKLTNITVRQGDLAALSFERAGFDFIICHGVFSWVPRPVQDAILRICGDSLRPGGVAAVSANMLPGWHMRRIVRDLLMFHADPKLSPAERVARARKALGEIAGAAAGSSPYVTLLRSEAARLAKAPSAYVLGEFLAEQNAPAYFSEFAARAAAAGLGYLCDGEVATSLPEYFSPGVAKRVREMAGASALAVQQYTDFLTGRPFRRSLFVRAAEVPAPVAAIDPARARHLHFAADLRLRAAPSKAGERVFADARGRPIRPKGPVSSAVVEGLADAYPGTRSLDELLPGAAPEAVAKALQVLTLLLISEQASASTVPLRVGSADAARPRAWALARLEAAAGQPLVTGQHHAPVRLTPALAQLMPLLDGTNDRAALARAVAAPALDEALNFAARSGLLEA